MKYAFFLILAILSLINPLVVGAEKTALIPSTIKKSASPSAEIDRIEKIKEMVASRVAELKLVEKRGFIGVVKEISNTQLTLEDKKGNKRLVDIDELSKFNDPGSKTFGISDVKKGDTLVCLGLYNKDNKRLLARFINKAKTSPKQIEGVIVNKNKTDFILDVATEDGKTFQVEVETSTKIQSYQKEEGLKKAGFSKITTGQRILATGFFDLKKTTQLNADRILYFIDIPGSEKMKNNQTNSEQPTPTGIK